MADLEHFLTPGLFDDTRQVSEILQSFFSFESEMQKIQRRHTHHFKDDKTGNLSTHLKPADSCAGLAQKSVLVATDHQSFTWCRNAHQLCGLSRFLHLWQASST